MDFPKICPARLLFDQNIGMCTPHDFLLPFYDANPNYFRPWTRLSGTKAFESTIENNKGNFKITLDVQSFRPNEVSVRVNDQEIIVEGKHEERADLHGFVARQFKRRYALPDRCPPENVTSTLSSDGVLTIIAEKQSLTISEKTVPIKICDATKKTEVENVKTQKGVIDINNNRQLVLMEDHSRLLKPELLKAVPELNSDNTEPILESKQSENSSASASGATSNTLKESFRKYNLEMSELMAEMAKKPTATTSGLKIESETTKENRSSSYESSTSMAANMKASEKTREYSNETISAALREAAENTQ